MLGTVAAVDAASRQVTVETQDRTGVPVSYDYLILATGQTHSYFGHNEYEKYAPGLKNLADAVATLETRYSLPLKWRRQEDPTQHRDLLTFVPGRRGTDGSRNGQRNRGHD